jgi:hypothetical protein
MNDPDPSSLIYKGKRACDLTREEAIECALHFHAAHLASHIEACRAERRMRFMEEALSKEQIRKLDDWLSDHNAFTPDAQKGDGTPLYRSWQEYDTQQVIRADMESAKHWEDWEEDNAS